MQPLELHHPVTIPPPPPSRLTTLQLILIITHHSSYYSDVATMLNFWQQDLHYYFWITLICLTISWLLSGITLIFRTMKDKKLKAFTFWFFHLDYIAFMFLDHSDANKSFDNKTSLWARKLFGLFVQSTPALLITLHSIFILNNRAPVAQISIAFSILDLCYSNAILSILRIEYMNMRLNMHALKRLLPQFLALILEMTMVLVLWGFISILYRPWGAWIFVMASFGVGFVIFFSTIIRKHGFCQAFKGGIFWGALFIFIGTMNFDPNNRKPFSIRNPFTKLRLVQLIGLLTALACDFAAFSSLFSDSFWLGYALAGLLCGFMWLLFVVFVSVVGHMREEKVDLLNESSRRESESERSIEENPMAEFEVRQWPSCDACGKELKVGFHCKECPYFGICRECQLMLSHPHELVEGQETAMVKMG